MIMHQTEIFNLLANGIIDAIPQGAEFKEAVLKIMRQEGVVEFSGYLVDKASETLKHKNKDLQSGQKHHKIPSATHKNASGTHKNTSQKRKNASQTHKSDSLSDKKGSGTHKSDSLFTKMRYVKLRLEAFNNLC